MKKRYMVLAVVLALSILVLSGCSSFIEDAVTAMLTSSQDEEESVSESLTSESSTSEGSTTSQSESWTEGSTAIESQTAESSDSHETEDTVTITQADDETTAVDPAPAEVIEETEEAPEEAQTEEVYSWSAADTVASWSGTTWRLVDYHYSNVASMSIDEIDAYMEETIVFGGTTDDTTIGIGSDLSYLATYDEQSLTDTYMVDLGSWWNSTDEVVLVAQNGVFGLGEQFFVGSGGTLWLSFDGVYFQAQQIG